MSEIFIAILLLSGSFFVVVAAIGVLRLPDLMMKMHASTKAGTLGAGLTLLAVSVAFDEISVLTRVIATILFLLLTAPIAAHLIARSAYYVGMDLWENTIIDELKNERAENNSATNGVTAEMNSKEESDAR
ncbi:MAG: monovalent cation/H(+) antiporter subunit G [Balneolales bacterium]|nr:monovalent cation/H(+) antiporter subunit G [Balneolales bacterium]